MGLTVKVRNSLKRCKLSYTSPPGLDEAKQAGEGQRGAHVAEGSHNPSDAVVIDRSRVDWSVLPVEHLLLYSDPMCTRYDIRHIRKWRHSFQHPTMGARQSIVVGAGSVVHISFFPRRLLWFQRPELLHPRGWNADRGQVRFH